MDRLQRDESRRGVLRSSWEIYEAAVEEGIIGEGGIDLLVRSMQELHGEGLIAHGPRNLGTSPGPVWDGSGIQQMHQWRVTAAGRQDAKSFREETKLASGQHSSAHITDFTDSTGTVADSHDVFISHASEDKETVARPLVDALAKRGWTAWLDELELTVGDSLTGRIDQALARSRFGVVILSQAFFAKQWPQRELAGLTAREVQSGTKVILPVWHQVDQEAIVQFSPTLADRVGVPTSKGIDHVADQLSRALETAIARPPTSSGTTERMMQAVPVQHPQLAEAEVWAAEHVFLLVACFERFQSEGEWPTLEQLQHDFELAGRDEDVSRSVWAMPGLLGSAVQQHLQLLVRALLHVAAAEPLLEDWCSVVKRAYDRWLADPNAEITRADVLHLLDDDPRRTRYVSLLFEREGWPFGSGHGSPDDDWSREVISAVRDARDANSPLEIITARNRTEFPVPTAGY